MPPLRPKVRSDLSVVEIEGEAVIYDEQTDKIHYLNRTATIVFNLCDGLSTIPQFSGEIAESFSLTPGEVERQVRSLIRNFREAGFLEGPASKQATASNGSRSSKGGRKSTKSPPKRTNRSRTGRT
jgi:coenzyme PQQ synthesis protein D (PqqD)